MAAYRMTAKRKAALRKAQLASARKRRKGGPKRKGRIRRTASAAKREYNRKNNYAKKHYKGRGRIYRMNSDRYHSRGAYSKNWRGKTYGKKMKRANKVAMAALMAHPGNQVAYRVSQKRNKSRKKRR